MKHLLSFSDPRTAWQHWVIMALAARCGRGGNPLPVYRPTPNGDLRAGRLTYRHPTTAKAVKNPLHGILFERLLIDVPDPIDHPDLEQAAADLGARARRARAGARHLRGGHRPGRRAGVLRPGLNDRRPSSTGRSERGDQDLARPRRGGGPVREQPLADADRRRA